MQTKNAIKYHLICQESPRKRESANLKISSENRYRKQNKRNIYKPFGAREKDPLSRQTERSIAKKLRLSYRRGYRKNSPAMYRVLGINGSWRNSVS